MSQYCNHSHCRTAAIVELCYMAVTLNRANLLQTAIKVRNTQPPVRCRENRDFTDAPLPMLEEARTM